MSQGEPATDWLGVGAVTGVDEYSGSVVRSVQRDTADGLIREIPINHIDAQLPENVLDVHPFVIRKRGPDALVNTLGQLVTFVPRRISRFPERNSLAHIVNGLRIAPGNV